MSKIHYYVTGNTSEGFVNYTNSNLKEMHHIFVLKHKSHKVKSAILEKLIEFIEEKHDVEVFLSALGEKYLDGFIIRDQSTAVVVDNIYNMDYDNVKVIELATYVEEIPMDQKERQAKNQFKAHLQQAYDHFAQGLKIHDELESIYIDEMDFNRADKLADEFIENILANIPKKEKKSITYKRLFGTNTPEGAVNIVPEILSTIQHAYFIKGRAGTGKSTFMKKVLAACQEHGFEIEVYHCSFDPGSIDMVLVRELSFCIFDSTNPHEFFPKRDGHHVIDMYEETVKSGTDEKYADQIKDVTSRYKSFMKKGAAQLKKAGHDLDEIEKHYDWNINQNQEVMQSIYSQINSSHRL